MQNLIAIIIFYHRINVLYGAMGTLDILSLMYYNFYMTELCKFFCIITFAILSPLYAHLCDNVFRQADKLIVKPEIYNIIVKDKATFKIFLQNNMDRAIAEIKLIAESPAFDFQIYPMKMSVPKDQRVYFEVTMTPKPNTSSGNYPVTFRLVGGGREFKSFNLDVSGEAANRVQEKKETPMSENKSSPETQPSRKKESALLSVKKIFQPPKIDGRLMEECWKNAGVAGNFSCPGQGKPVYQTVGLFTYDASSLYLGFYCRDNEPEKISDKDRIEIQISSDPSGKTYYSIVLTGDRKMTFKKVRSSGEVQDLQPANLVYGMYRGINAWMIEIGIPFSSIGTRTPEPGETWLLKIIRTKSTGYIEESYWAMDASSYHQEKGFGQIVFAP
ncbi:MAG: hypothetical protein NC902_01815 [Candidatus Omnitrophica bacterium]|nr:hypothetical protein [Candidatus Omnitrophota bacterium]